MASLICCNTGSGYCGTQFSPQAMHQAIALLIEAVIKLTLETLYYPSA